MSNSRHALLALGLTGLLTALSATTSYAVDLRIAWQPIVEPSKVPQADGAYEAATGANITWSRFEGGADVIAAIASGSIDIGYVGSSPLTVAASQQLPIETIFIVGNIAEAEALAVKGVTKPEELVGKKIATPFVSTGHYSLLTALKHWGIESGSLEILNLRPPEIAAAWERGDIDGAYVWDPVLAQLKAGGATVLADSADVAQWGGPTFDAWIVRKDFAEANPDIVNAFVKVTGEATDAYIAAPESWNADSAEAKKIADLSGANLADVQLLLKGYVFPSLEQQAGPDFLGGGTATAVAATATFLAEQGRISGALPDYSPYVSTAFVKAALAK
ncbi:taurine ABC transporter substrate-binding protein [Devosia sp. 2618]|uniref:taurine ABC transporter substrate-binding protein n=1 Tax=Devosia sp. 2618 TaxID=3156454 RepID=UPI003394D23C